MRALVVSTALALSLLPRPGAAEEPLRVSAIPDESPTELQRKFEPLGKYLEAQLGRPVRFTPVTDYAATVEGLAAGKLDLVWYGGFTFVQARRRTGTAIPLVQREEDAHFHSKFIVPAASKAQTLKELTVTPEYKIGKHFVVRGDLRCDWSDQEVFQKRAL